MLVARWRKGDGLCLRRSAVPRHRPEAAAAVRADELLVRVVAELGARDQVTVFGEQIAEHTEVALVVVEPPA